MSASSSSNTGPAPAPTKIPTGIKFLFSGSAGMGATLFVQPLDLVKNRMQLSGVGGQAREHKTSLHAIRNILKTEGLFAMYTGLSAGLFRQATYTTARLGVYTTLLEMFSKDGKPPGFFTNVLLAVTAGGIGAFVGTPAEVALIRMTSDGRLPPEQRRAYKHVFNALARIFKEEGLLKLWRGCVPTIGRSMVVNGAQLTSYTQAKQKLLQTGYFTENLMLHFCASMFSGLVTTIASLPVDIAKTRIQSMKTINGVPEYSGALLWVFSISNCLMATIIITWSCATELTVHFLDSLRSAHLLSAASKRHTYSTNTCTILPAPICSWIS